MFRPDLSQFHWHSLFYYLSFTSDVSTRITRRTTATASSTVLLLALALVAYYFSTFQDEINVRERV
jgi:hypothetical protein